MRPVHLSLVCAFGLLTLAPGASAQEATPDPPSFHHDVRPILQAHCMGCHQPAKAALDLDLTSHSATLLGSEAGEVVVAGDPGDSLLLEVVRSIDGEAPEMPPGDSPLSDAEVDVLRRWIEAGALDDTPASLTARGRRREPAGLRPGRRSSPASTGPRTAAWSRSPDTTRSCSTPATGSGLQGRLIGLSERIQSARLLPDGARLAVVGGAPGRFGEVQVLGRREAELLLSKQVTYDTLYGVSWSPDGTRIACGGGDTVVYAFEVPSGKRVLYQGAHDDWVLGTVWSTDSTHLVSVGRDRSMKLYKVESQQFIDNITSITPGALRADSWRCVVIRRRTSSWWADPTASRGSSRCTARRSG